MISMIIIMTNMIFSLSYGLEEAYDGNIIMAKSNKNFYFAATSQALESKNVSRKPASTFKTRKPIKSYIYFNSVWQPIHKTK